MAVGDKYPVLMASQLGTPNGPAALNAEALLPILQGGVEAGNTQQALANLGAGVRPNHLVNSNFSVNQRGWVNTLRADNQRIHDMWDLSWTPGSTGNAQALADGGVSVISETVVGNDPGGSVTNKFEKAIDGEWTLSVFMKVDSLPKDSFIAIQIANDTKKEYKTYSISPETARIGKYAVYSLSVGISGWEDSDIMRVSVYNYGGQASFSLKNAKLEPGANQTLAYQDSTGAWKLLPQPDADYGIQLAKCQRYQLALWRYFISPAVQFQPNYIDFSITIPIEMRTTPALTQSDFLVSSDAKGNQSGFVLSVAGTSSNALRVRATKEGHGLTPSDAVRIEVNVERAILDANM